MQGPGRMVGFWSLSSDPDVESAGKKERARGGERLWTGWVKVLAESQPGPVSNPGQSLWEDAEFMNNPREGLEGQPCLHVQPHPTKGPPGLTLSPRVRPCWGQRAHQAHAEGSWAWSLTCLLGRTGPAAPPLSGAARALSLVGSPGCSPH